MSLGFMQVTAPLGLIMLGLTALLGIFFVAYVVYLQTTVLLETRRHTKEMQAQRDLADKAEASRFTELRNFLEAQENTHMARNAERHAALLARVEQLETAIKAALRPDRQHAGRPHRPARRPLRPQVAGHDGGGARRGHAAARLSAATWPTAPRPPASWRRPR